MTPFSILPFIFRQIRSGAREGADSPLAPVDATGGETRHRTRRHA